MPAKTKPGDVRRRFHLASPGEKKGADTSALQKAINGKFDHLKIDRQIAVDGEYGRQTADAARQIAVCMGVGGQNLKSLRRGTVTKSVQNLIRELRPKTRGEKLRTVKRKPYRRKLRKRYAATPGQKVIQWANAQLGTTENPPGSNRGPKIDVWCKFWGLVAPQWCGCFAGYAVRVIGGAKVTSWLPYAPSITADAKANRNGLTAVPFSAARAGDLVTFWNGQHIGLVVRVDGDELKTIEGNTSSGNAGSQSNGGGVFPRTRKRSDVDVIARPAY